MAKEKTLGGHITYCTKIGDTSDFLELTEHSMNNAPNDQRNRRKPSNGRQTCHWRRCTTP